MLIQIQILLLLVAVGLLALFVRNWHTVEARALKRLAFLGFVGLVVIAVLSPNSVTWVAHRVGVGRGADLVLYLLAAAFVFVSVNTYFRFRVQESRFTELARSIAVREALTLNAQRFGSEQGKAGRP